MGFDVIESDSKGYAKSLNLGIQQSTSKYIGFLNSDDLQATDRLQKQIALMESEGNNMSISKIQKFSGRRKIFDLSGSQIDRQYRKTQLLLGAYGANASLILLRDSKAIAQFEDVDMSDWHFAFQNYPEEMTYSQESTYLYRMHPKQITRKRIDTPNWLLNEWSRLFSRISHERIPNSVIEACCRPNLLKKLDFEEFDVFTQTLLKIRTTLESETQGSVIQLNNLILRRFLLATRGNLLQARKFLGELGINERELLFKFSRIAAENIYNAERPRR
jgi:glycosyltransferase involved in cell wall biosynthesis